MNIIQKNWYSFIRFIKLSYIGRLAERAGFNKAVFSTAITTLFKLGAGPVTILLVLYFLNSKEQGYWYTFGSIAALNILADLGFTNIILQFTSHEYANLSRDLTGKLCGDTNSIKRISALLYFSIRWMLLLICIILPITIIVGYFVFTSQKNISNISWGIPWILYVISGGLTLFINMIFSFIEGCDQITKGQTIRLGMAISVSLTMWASMSAGWGLYSLSIGSFAGCIFGFIILQRKFKHFWLQMRENKNKDFYFRDIFFLQIRYAISWIGGYLVFNLFNPLVFYYHGQVAAGKVGMTLYLVSAVSTVSIVWFVAKIPQFNIYVAKKDWISLDILYNKSSIMSLLTLSLGTIIIILAVLFLEGKVSYLNRLLPLSSIIVLGITSLANLLVYNMAAYLRAHKKEPLWHLSLMHGLLSALFTWFIVKSFDVKFVFLGYAFEQIFIIFPLAYIIWYKFKREFHT